MKKLRLALVLAAALSLRVLDAASISAELTADETSVGMPVQLQVQVEGTTNAALPSSLDVDGLQTQLTGRSTQVQIINGQMSVSGVYSYTILPMREGTFEIPALEVNAGGRKLKTSPRKLVVQAGRAPAPRPAPALPSRPGMPSQGDEDSGNSQLAYAEIIVPKKERLRGRGRAGGTALLFQPARGFPRAAGQPAGERRGIHRGQDFTAENRRRKMSVARFIACCPTRRRSRP